MNHEILKTCRIKSFLGIPTRARRKDMDRQKLADDLDKVLREPALHRIKGGKTSYEEQHAALNYGIALGRCRVFGVELGELDGTMPPEVAVQGLKAAYRRIQAKIEELKTLGDRLKATEDSEHREMIMFSQYEFAMEVIGFYYAALEAYLANPAYNGLEKRMADTCSLMSKFFWAFEESKPLLKRINTHPILNEWRENYVQEPFPAWLEA
jgi:hypothetical protein